MYILDMATRVEVPDEIHREFKAEAVRRGYTMQEAIVIALDQWVTKSKARPTGSVRAGNGVKS